MTQKMTTVEWMQSCVETAIQESRKGNITLINQLGMNPCFNAYINNVQTGFVRPQDYGEKFPELLKEADALRESWEKAAAAEGNTERISKLEENLATLTETVAKGFQSLQEALQPADPKKPAKGKTKLAEAEGDPEGDPEGEEDPKKPAEKPEGDPAKTE